MTGDKHSRPGGFPDVALVVDVGRGERPVGLATQDRRAAWHPHGVSKRRVDVACAQVVEELQIFADRDRHFGDEEVVDVRLRPWERETACVVVAPLDERAGGDESKPLGDVASRVQMNRAHPCAVTRDEDRVSAHRTVGVTQDEQIAALTKRDVPERCDPELARVLRDELCLLLLVGEERHFDARRVGRQRQTPVAAELARILAVVVARDECLVEVLLVAVL